MTNIYWVLTVCQVLHGKHFIDFKCSQPWLLFKVIWGALKVLTPWFHPSPRRSDFQRRGRVQNTGDFTKLLRWRLHFAARVENHWYIIWFNSPTCEVGTIIISFAVKSQGREGPSTCMFIQLLSSGVKLGTQWGWLSQPITLSQLPFTSKSQAKTMGQEIEYISVLKLIIWWFWSSEWVKNRCKHKKIFSISKVENRFLSWVFTHSSFCDPVQITLPLWAT